MWTSCRRIRFDTCHIAHCLRDVTHNDLDYGLRSTINVVRALTVLHGLVMLDNCHGLCGHNIVAVILESDGLGLIEHCDGVQQYKAEESRVCQDIDENEQHDFENDKNELNEHYCRLENACE